MNGRPPACEQGGDCTGAPAFLEVQPGGFGPMVGTQHVLAPHVDPTRLRIGHTGLHTVSDQPPLEFWHLRHHSEQQAAGWRLQVDTKRRDDNANGACIAEHQQRSSTARGEGLTRRAARLGKSEKIIGCGLLNSRVQTVPVRSSSSNKAEP